MTPPLGRMAWILPGATGAVLGGLGALVILGGLPAAAAAVAIVGGAWCAWLLCTAADRPVRLGLAASGVAFAAAALASQLVAREPSDFALLLAAAPAGAALVASLLATPEARRGAARGLTFLLGACGIVSVAMLAMGRTTPVGVVIGDHVASRLYPPGFAHPNHYAAVLTMLVPFAVAQIAVERGWPRFAGAACLALGLAALLLTYSRGFWLAAGVAALVAAGSRRARLVALAVGGVGAAALSPWIVGRLASEDTLDNPRIDIWHQAVRVITDHPVLGVGAENFPLHAAGVVVPLTLEAPYHAHNLLLATASEIGLVGAGALVAGIIVLVRGVMRGPLGPMDRAVVLGCGGCLAAIVVGGTFDTLVFHSIPALAAGAAVIGLTAAVTYAGGRRERPA